MLKDLNRTTLIGYLGADPKQHQNEDGPVTFSIATTDRWTDDQGKQGERTDWHTISVYNGLRKYALTLKKGDRVYVEAKLVNNHYEKTVGGETIKIYGHRLNAQEIERLTAKADAQSKESTEFPYGEAKAEPKPQTEQKAQSKQRKK